MADNYQQFSEIIESITPEERAWIEQVLEQEPQASELKEAGIDLEAIEIDYWPSFAFEFESEGAKDRLWLYASESGDLNHVGEFVRAFLARFRPDQYWSLTWSDSCSKPRIGEFGGGALFVTAQSVSTFTAGDYIAQRRRAFERRIHRKPQRCRQPHDCR